MKRAGMENNFVPPWENSSYLSSVQPADRAVVGAEAPQSVVAPKQAISSPVETNYLSSWEEEMPKFVPTSKPAVPSIKENPIAAQPIAVKVVEVAPNVVIEDAALLVSRESEQITSHVAEGIQRMINGDPTGEGGGAYTWCYDKYIAGCSNHWMPQEVNMDIDVAQWRNGLPEGQVRLLKRVMGFFSTADSLAANNIVLGTLRHIKSKEARRYLKRQAFEEAIHTHTYQYIAESLGLDQQEIFNAYNEVETIKAKDEFLMPYIDVLTDPDFKSGNPDNDRKLLKSIIMFAAIMEGLMFYGGFANIFALGRQRILPGACTQIQLIARDEALHSSFGMDVANKIKHENPHLWTDEFKAEIAEAFSTAVNLEIDFIREMIPEPMFGINSQSQEDYIKFICNRRCDQVGINRLYPEIKQNPLPWMSEMLDIKRETNFFEKRVTEYQAAQNLTWG